MVFASKLLSLVEDFRTAFRRNLCRVLKGFMVIGKESKVVNSIPDRINSLVVRASCYWSIGKGKLKVRNFLDTF